MFLLSDILSLAHNMNALFEGTNLFSSGNWTDPPENSGWYDNSPAAYRSPGKVLPGSAAGIWEQIVMEVRTEL
jgi:hypothetical protein